MKSLISSTPLLLFSNHSFYTYGQMSHSTDIAKWQIVSATYLNFCSQQLFTYFQFQLFSYESNSLIISNNFNLFNRFFFPIPNTVFLSFFQKSLHFLSLSGIQHYQWCQQNCDSNLLSHQHSALNNFLCKPSFQPYKKCFEKILNILRFHEVKLIPSKLELHFSCWKAI